MIIFSLVFLFFIGASYSSFDQGSGFGSYGEGSLKQMQSSGQPYNYHPSAPSYSLIYVDSELQSYLSKQFPQNNNCYTKANIDQWIAWSYAQKELEVLQSCGYDVVPLSNAINKTSPSEFDENKFFAEVTEIKNKRNWSWQENFNNAFRKMGEKGASSFLSFGSIIFIQFFRLPRIVYPLIVFVDGIQDGVFAHAEKRSCSCHAKQKSFSCAYLWLRAIVVPAIVTLIYYKLRAR